MRLRLFLVAAACVAVTAVFPVIASAQPRMMIGFQDDPSLRWRDDRLNVFDLGEQAHAGIVRTTVYWSRIAQTRPANGANPFDPAYAFDDLDEFVRNAGLHGMEVMLTIWGTPAWANGGKGQNFAPTKLLRRSRASRALLRRATRAVTRASRSCATTRSGTSRTSASSSHPSTTRRASRSHRRSTRSSTGQPTRGSRRATPARSSGSARPRPAGATATWASRARRRPSHRGSSRSCCRSRSRRCASTPGRTTRIRRRSQASRWRRLRWPNVTLSNLPRFENQLGHWFKRNVIMWITEYGHETKPEEPKGVTYAQQAAYLRTALRFAANDPQGVDLHLVHPAGRPDQRLAERSGQA